MSGGGDVVFSGAGKKFDAGKPRYDLQPPRATREWVEVLTYGAKKYEANGWRKVVGWRWRYLRAGLTHVAQYSLAKVVGDRRLERDEETGLHHLAHAMCCFSFVLDNELSLEAGAQVPDGDAPAPPDSQQQHAIVHLDHRCAHKGCLGPECRCHNE